MERVKQAPNWWALRCAAAYWSARTPQLERVEAWAADHAADIADYYERVEPRVTFCGILIHQGREWRHERGATLDGQ